ncbi:MAG: acetyl-CoA decarbonylase/synthase complex subunit alpha/beta [Polyangia bacterium]|jgi:acetyl-CoA synthase|nr:acetyl-CoA decarbonylase/synthase complex subunit alpha/beta [Polyangia bacterium]
MSKTIASAGIRGAHELLARARQRYDVAREKHGGRHEIGFPNTGYYLPCIYGILGHRIERLDDMEAVFERCIGLLPPLARAEAHLPSRGPALDAGMAALFAQEMEEGIRYLERPGSYFTGEDPEAGRLWLGAADDVILRRRGVEFLDGTARGFAAILGAAPSKEVAVRIAQELQQKNLYVFMVGEYEGRRFSEQLLESGAQMGWSTRLVPLGPDVSAAVFAFGFATRAAMFFGGVEPGDSRRILAYIKDRVLAFAMTLGFVTDEWCASALACESFGFPVIADASIPESPSTGICTCAHMVSNISHDEIVQRAVEVRGIKISVSKVDVPVAYGAAFEGERVRGPETYFEGGGGRDGAFAVEWTTAVDMEEIEDHEIEVVGPDLDALEPNSRRSIAVKVKVAGRAFQRDFEPILERQIHRLVSFAQGCMHTGQRDTAWFRISRGAYDNGFRLRHIGEILWAKYHQDFGAILDKVSVTIYTGEAEAQDVLREARAAYAARDERIAGIKDEEEPSFYGCTICQSIAPSHVCVVTPERSGLCGAYSWLDCRAAYEITPTGPNQPIQKGRVLDERRGQWEGVNEFVRKASWGTVERINVYSIMEAPMTSSHCTECFSAVMPLCNGVMTVSRDYAGMTPSGMTFSTLVGSVGGGVVTPGFIGHSKLYIVSEKYLRAEGGIARLCWMPRRLKEELLRRIDEAGARIGIDGFANLIADETIGTDEMELLDWLTEKGHPAIGMEPLL